MKLLLKTLVRQSLPQVWAGFDRNLFEKLAPPFPPVEVVRFDGCAKGDIVHLRLNFLFFKQDWISDITDQQTTGMPDHGMPDHGMPDHPNEIFFVDEGRKLPFFLRYWHHRHRLVRDAETGGTVVIDDITFRTPTLLTDWLFYPLLWLQFAYRKPIYKRVFR
jgi:ligand-binding SRPBCC domain-containing protein